MRERDAPAWKRQRDLARVKMPGEDEIEGALRQPVDHVRKVAEQDSQVRLRVGQAHGLREPPAVGARVDADDLHMTSPHLDRPCLVEQQRRRLEIADRRPRGERIVGLGKIVVAEYRVAIRQPRQQLPQQRLAAAA